MCKASVLESSPSFCPPNPREKNLHLLRARWDGLYEYRDPSSLLSHHLLTTNSNFFSLLSHELFSSTHKHKHTITLTPSLLFPLQSLWFDSDCVPEWLADVIVNSPAALMKTALWISDGRFRQFESHSCAQVEKNKKDFSLFIVIDHHHKCVVIIFA